MASTCTEKMSFYRPEWGSDGSSLNFQAKQQSRWQFQIQNITSGDVANNPLPCIKASRPKLNFREMQAEHLNEIISFPSKPEWQPIQLSIYDRCIPYQHPVMTWLQQQYDPFNCSKWYPCIDPLSYKTCATLILLDACGNIAEAWKLEHCYPQSIDFGELDMQSMNIITAEVTLKYDRAYQIMPDNPHILYTACSDSCETLTCDASTSGGSGGIDSSGTGGGSPGDGSTSISRGENLTRPGPGGEQSPGGFAPRMPDFIMF